MQILTNALPYLPEEVLVPLCSALENISLAPAVIKQLTTRYHQEEEKAER